MRHHGKHLAAAFLESCLEHFSKPLSIGVVYVHDRSGLYHFRGCLACHNARMAKGRLNLETFAGLKKGGDSGESVEPGNGEDSILFQLVADGSMPEDDDFRSKVIEEWSGREP